MTQTETKRNKSTFSSFELVRWVSCIVLLVIALLYRDKIGMGISSGITLSIKSIIPTLFPFMIIADLIFSVDICNLKMSRVYSRLFGFPICTSEAFILGNLCGFPIGAKMIGKLYEDGGLNSGEVAYMLGVVTNPSLAFTIGVVGGMRGNAADGIILYFSLISATVAVGKIFNPKNEKYGNSSVISRQSFDLNTSIKSTGYNLISVCSYIVFFSAVISLASCFISDKLIMSIIASLLEVGNATSIIYQSFGCGLESLILTGFALGFSGCSVFMQAFSFFKNEIHRSTYLIMKLSEGLLTAFFAGSIKCITNLYC